MQQQLNGSIKGTTDLPRHFFMSEIGLKETREASDAKMLYMEDTQIQMPVLLLGGGWGMCLL